MTYQSFKFQDGPEGKKPLKDNLQQGFGKWSQDWRAIHLHIK